MRVVYPRTSKHSEKKVKVDGRKLWVLALFDRIPCCVSAKKSVLS